MYHLKGDCPGVQFPFGCYIFQNNPVCRFEVFFVGAEARIDMRGSADWLKEKTSQWNFPVHIKVSLHLHFSSK